MNQCIHIATTSTQHTGHHAHELVDPASGDKDDTGLLQLRQLSAQVCYLPRIHLIQGDRERGATLREVDLWAQKKAQSLGLLHTQARSAPMCTYLE